MRWLLLITLAACSTKPAAPDAGAAKKTIAPTADTVELDRWRDLRRDGSALSQPKERPRMAAFVDGTLRIDWYSSHPCGMQATPRAEVDGAEVRLMVALSGAEWVDCAGEVVAYRTTVRDLTAPTVHISGPHNLSLRVSRTIK